MTTRIIRFLFGAILAGMIAVMLLVLPMPISSAPAARYYTVVTSTADEFDTSGTGTGCSLREAIHLAEIFAPPTVLGFGGCTTTYFGVFGAFTIFVPEGTYTLTRVGAGEDLDATGDLDIRSTVSIIGSGIVNVTANPGWNDRIFHVVSGTATIQGINISNGAITSGAGGGVFNAGTTTLSNVTFSNNSTIGGGGAIYNVGNLTLANAVLNGNSAANGGGIYNDGTTTLSNVTFGGNSAANGGGIYSNKTMTLIDGTLNNNSANNNGSGGGIYNNAGSMSLSNVTLSSNSGSDSGGGIQNYLGSATLTNVTLSGNSTTNYGGGIYNTGIISNGTIIQSFITLTNASLSANSAYAGGGIGNLFGTVVMTNGTLSGNFANGGGGIWSDGMVLTLTNVTFSGNQAKNGTGGGIYNIGSGGLLSNITLSRNLASSGSGIYEYNGYAPPVLTIQNTIFDQLVGGNCSFFGIPNISNGYNLSSDSSCFLNMTSDISNTNPELAPLGNYGGLTLTHIPYGGSPALDHIPNGTNGCGTTITTDQRGKPRPVNSACDIGAVERQIIDGPFLYLPLIVK